MEGLLEVMICGAWGRAYHGFVVTGIDEIATKTREYVALRGEDSGDLQLAQVKFTPLADGINNGLAVVLGDKETDIENVSIGFLGKDQVWMRPHLEGNPEIAVSVLALPSYRFSETDPPAIPKRLTIVDFILADHLDNWYEIYHSGN